MRTAQRRIKNWLWHSHMSGRAWSRTFGQLGSPVLGGVAYVIATPFTAATLLPFLVLEPEAFDHADHI